MKQLETKSSIEMLWLLTRASLWLLHPPAVPACFQACWSK